MSEKAVAQKMYIKPGQRVLLLNAPPGLDGVLAGLPEGASVDTRSTGPADVILCFLMTMQELKDKLPQLKAALKPGGALWIAYPKGTSKLAGDANRDTIRGYASGVGLEAVSIVAIDDDWSAMRTKAA